MKKTLFDQLVQYGKSDIYPFCMPGHKRNFQIPGVENPYDIDITEVEGFDNLHDPSGIIKEMQERLQDVYEMPQVLLSVNGSSAGVLAAVCAAPRGAVCVARNCHKSVFDAVSLSRRKVYYLYPEEVIKDSFIYGGIDPEAVEQMLKRHSEISTVVITSPTYEGFLSDVEAIAEIAHRYDAILIVDEAHGAHLPYHDRFPVSSIYLDADIIIQSLHKTLPSLNQTALVFVKENGALAAKVRRALSMFTTTSPSYALLASIQYCVEWSVDNQQEFDNYVEMLLKFRERYAQLAAVTLLGKELIGTHGIFDVDLTKLVFVSAQMPGPDLGRYLLNEHHLQMEAAGPDHVLALTGVSDTEAGMKRLYKGLASAAKLFKYPKTPVLSKQQLEKIALAYVSKIGKPYNDFIYLYPPGCPILAPGEMFTQECRDQVLSYIEQGLEVIEWERFTF